jgi:hypothetical protein
LLIFGIIALASCAGPQKFEPPDEFKPFDIEQRNIKPFKLRVDKLAQILEKVHKMDKPVPIYLIRKGDTSGFDWEGELPEDAQVIGYLVKEHNKIVAKVQQGKMMTEIAELLVQRIQIEVELYNSMIELVKLQDVTIQRYRTLWINAENRVVQVEYKLKQQRVEHKVTLGVIGTIAAVIAVALVL